MKKLFWLFIRKFSKNIFSFDAETNGLWGRAFAIAAVVMTASGKKTFMGRCPIEGEVDPFVAENVLPQMEGIEINYPDYRSMLEAFMAFYMENKANADIIVHMGLPVEARLFIDAHDMGIIGDWDAPYPLLDICTFPEIGTSVDEYNAKNGIVIPDMEGGTHNPMFDSIAALYAYIHYVGK